MRKYLGLTIMIIFCLVSSGLVYGRNFASQLARFTSPDPVIITKQRIGTPQGLNMYSYVQNNPLKYVDPDGKDIAVIENGPTTTPEEFARTRQGNPVGHTAFAVTGHGVFSAGNDTKPGTSMSKYVTDQAVSRDTSIVIMKTTPAQDQAAIDSFMSSTNVPLEKFPDNCSNRTNKALDAAGIPLSPPPSMSEVDPSNAMGYLLSVVSGVPGTAGNRAYNYNLSTGTGSSLYIKKGTTSVPGALKQFDPGGKPAPTDEKKQQAGTDSSS